MLAVPIPAFCTPKELLAVAHYGLWLTFSRRGAIPARLLIWRTVARSVTITFLALRTIALPVTLLSTKMTPIIGCL